MVRGPTLLGTAISGLPARISQCDVAMAFDHVHAKGLLQAEACCAGAAQRSDCGGHDGRTRGDRRWRVCRRVDSIACTNEACKDLRSTDRWSEI